MLWPQELRWALEPFNAFLEFYLSEIRLLILCEKALHRIPAMVGTSKFLYDLDQETQGMSEEQSVHRKKLIAEAEDDASFAQREAAIGFPRLHAHFLVGIWGAHESLVENIALSWLCNDPTVWERTEIKKVQISLADYEYLQTREDRAHYVINQIQKSSRFTSAPPVVKMENLLDDIGLGGGLDDDVKKKMFELGHIRNVIVHNCSIVDTHLIKNCPWIDYKINEKITLKCEDFTKYKIALDHYQVILINRVRQKIGLEPWEFKGTHSVCPCCGREILGLNHPHSFGNPEQIISG